MDILTNACCYGQVVCPCSILSKLDEQDPNAKPRCHLCGQISSILDLGPKAAILNFEENQKFFRMLGIRVK